MPSKTIPVWPPVVPPKRWAARPKRFRWQTRASVRLRPRLVVFRLGHSASLSLFGDRTDGPTFEAGSGHWRRRRPVDRPERRGPGWFSCPGYYDRDLKTTRRCFFRSKDWTDWGFSKEGRRKHLKSCFPYMVPPILRCQLTDSDSYRF